MKRIIFKITWLLSIVAIIIIFIIMKFNIKNAINLTCSTNYISLIIIIVIKLIFGVFLLKKKDNKLLYSLFIIFLAIIIFVPIYHIEYDYASTGSKSELMGLAHEEKYLNIYGMNIGNLFK